LRALAETALSVVTQTELNDLLVRNQDLQLSVDEVITLDNLLAKVDQLNIIKMRAKYSLYKLENKCLRKIMLCWVTLSLHPTYGYSHSLKFSINYSQKYYSSTAPNAFNVFDCASVKPVTPLIFIPSYGRGTFNIFRHSPVFKSHNLIVSS
jgi:hypothetical protein